MSRTRVKICGIRRLEDGLAAVRCGADALGFIFYSKSPRNISLEAAAPILRQLPPFVAKVAVLVNVSLAELVSIAGQGFTHVQLHGSESAEYCRQVRVQLPACGIIKAFRVGEDSLADDFTAYNDCVDAFLLDTLVKGARGGTGEVFDWSIVKRLHLGRPVILAGGLTPSNVTAAIAEVGPFAVDMNSGVETEPGVKDHALLQEAIVQVYRATLSSTVG